MHNYTIRQIILSHQPVGGGYGVAVQCSCGRDFSGQHQLDMLEADNRDTQS